MPLVLQFVTPNASAVAELVIKKSRFIGYLLPAPTVAAAEAALEDVRQQHKTATHHCYAYVVGRDQVVERFSDDGEPSGTAGRPMLKVLHDKGLSYALLVVVRYFGGTLLGAAGLVHAYTDASVAAVTGGELLTCRLVRCLDVTCDYGLYGKLEYSLGQLGYALSDKTFEANVRFRLWVPPAAAGTVMDVIGDGSNGQAVVTVVEDCYVGFAQDGRMSLDVPGNA